MAQPRMALYIRYSARIYSIYLRYFSPEDIHVYSIDEVFIDVSRYLAVQRKTPCELVKTLLRDIKAETGLVRRHRVKPAFHALDRGEEGF